MLETMKPMDIEKRSFEIITGLLEGRVLDPENEIGRASCRERV